MHIPIQLYLLNCTHTNTHVCVCVHFKRRNGLTKLHALHLGFGEVNLQQCFLSRPRLCYLSKSRKQEALKHIGVVGSSKKSKSTVYRPLYQLYWVYSNHDFDRSPDRKKFPRLCTRTHAHIVSTEEYCDAVGFRSEAYKRMLSGTPRRKCPPICQGREGYWEEVTPSLFSP